MEKIEEAPKSSVGHKGAVGPIGYSPEQILNKAKAIEFLVKYHESDYCFEEDGTFYLDLDKSKITASELYDKLMK